ncbi:MAG: hypothetical protein K6F80_03505 [Oscillospiraceae bacterium]|nr:hypothetical protein [Oscillospiraceae bacterium]
MAYIVSDQKHIQFTDGTSKKIVEVRCDAAADLPTADSSWLPGSVAWVIATGDIYGLNSSGTWVSQNSESE